ncbi:hypothetical protein PSH81_07080 [Pseudomonas sp. FP2335]|nr:hypothetical protein [Pseudomonas sp. FP2335]WLH80724.1 hypothetical protein PSH81_07080 [Pseudomonas sp. FP2335]
MKWQTLDSKQNVYEGCFEIIAEEAAAAAAAALTFLQQDRQRHFSKVRLW